MFLVKVSLHMQESRQRLVVLFRGVLWKDGIGNKVSNFSFKISKVDWIGLDFITIFKFEILGIFENFGTYIRKFIYSNFLKYSITFLCIQFIIIFEIWPFISSINFVLQQYQCSKRRQALIKRRAAVQCLGGQAGPRQTRWI